MKLLHHTEHFKAIIPVVSNGKIAVHAHNPTKYKTCPMWVKQLFLQQ